MSYFDTSLTTSASVNQAIAGITPYPGVTSSTITPPSSQVSQQINTTVTPVATNDSLVTGLASVDNYLRSAIQSTTATFDSATKSLASGISPSLGSIFANTNNAKSSTTSTLISDPVSTNLINNKTPGSGTFSISSLLAGSSPVTTTGATSIFGTGAASMQGTTLTTLLNRFNLDIKSVTALPTALTTNASSSKLSGLFATLAVDAGSVTGSLVKDVTGSSSLGGLTAGIATTLTASQLGVSSSPIVTRAVTNDLSTFLGNTGSLNKALGNSSTSALSNYFVTNPSYSLINATTGTGVSTNNSGVDATTANAILQAVVKTGCTTTITNYGSANVQASSFNLSLELAAINGMSDLVSSLLGCSHASTSVGQQSLTSAFTASSSSQAAISAQILQSIQGPAILNTPSTVSSVLTNPNLTSSDVGTVNSIFSAFGVTTQSAYTDPLSSSAKYPVYDVSLLANTQSSFLDASFGSSDFTNYLNGTPMTVTDSGSLDYFI